MTTALQSKGALPSKGEKVLFAFGGEGTTCATSDLELCKASASWPKCLAALAKLGLPADLVDKKLGSHTAPYCTVATTVVNITLCDTWRDWGYEPSFAVGHSVGEVAAAYAAGLYTLDEALAVALELGRAAEVSGAGGMLHTRVKDLTNNSYDGLALAAVNAKDKDGLSVSLCGSMKQVDAYVAKHDDATKLAPKHAWHSPTLFKEASKGLVVKAAAPAAQTDCKFVSSTKTDADELGEAHWRDWLTAPVDFAGAVAQVAQEASIAVTVELSAHPTLPAAAAISAHSATSMVRGAGSVSHALSQRAALEQALGRSPTRDVLKNRELWAGATLGDAEAPFAAQGFKSVEYGRVAAALAAWFPGLEAHDLYRFRSVDELLAGYRGPGAPVALQPALTGSAGAAFAVVGLGVALGGGVDGPAAFWRALAGADGAAYETYDGVLDVKKIRAEAAKLYPSPAEAEAAGDHQALALVLAHRAVADAGGPSVLGAGAAAKDRVGVYFGAWQRGGETGTASAYGALGEALGALPGRVAESLDARGPCLLVDTACSSALVALDAALSDLRRARVDWALVGGVNVHSGTDRLTAQLKRGRFLSPTGRCHAFSGKADGYARASGGAVVLLCRADLEGAPPAYAEVAGACTAQNRAQRPLSAVDGDAQERVVRGALMDAGASPASVGAIEAHGTGTPLGDPVEAAALQRIVQAGTVVSAAKARFGHLEAGAGAVGLVAAALYAHRGAVARRAIDGGAVSAAVLRAAPGLDFPGTEPSLVPLATDALVGVSSFGFAGSVAHAVLRRSSNGRALDAAYDAVEEVRVAAPVVIEPVASRPTSASWDGRAIGDAAPDILAAVWDALARVGAQPDAKGAAADVFDLGVDSLGLAEVVGALEAAYGDDCVSVDEVFENSTVAAIAAMVARGATTKGTVVRSASSHIFAVDEAPPPPAVVKQVKVAPVKRKAVVNRPTSATWFAATHVGSLPREPGASINDVVRKQVACGINLVNDGEYGRENYVSELLSRIDGCDGEAKGCCDLPCAADMAEVPTYASRFTGGNGLITLNPKRPAKGGAVCYALPTYVDNGGDLGLPALIEAAAAHGLGASSVFVSVPSPGTIACFVEDRHFATQAVGGFAGGFDAKAHKAYVNALAAAVALEYAKIVASGVRLQVDCPDLAMGCHTKWSALSDEQFVRDVCRVNVQALNSALKTAGASYETTRVHVCWGNYAGPHHRDIPMAKLWDAIQQLDASTLLLEAANPRHAWELDELLVEKPVSSTTIMAPGCIDSKIPAIEHPEKIARQLLKIAEQVGAWRVQACTDCGFASTARSAAVPAAIAWLKLEALGAGAKLARERVANANAVCRSPLKLAAVGFRVCVIGEASSVLVAALTKACWPWPLRVEHDVQQAVATHAHALDWPLAVVGAKASEAAALLNGESGARRYIKAFAFDGSDADAFATHVSEAMTAPQTFDKTSLAGRRCAPPTEVDVVVVGAGVCGLIAARAAQKRGLSVAVLERRNVVGGIWSSVANSSSQVNSSEGGYRLADLVDGDAPHKANRDHSPTSEVLSDIGKLADALGDQVYCGVAVAKILPSGTGSIVVATINGKAQTIQAKGVVVACNDRVGAPRQVQYEGQSTFEARGGLVARGIGDDLSTYDFRGKRVVIVGFGAFAVENVRTALEHGATHVTVVARRQGVVCPKIIDYLNFVKPFDADFAHDTTTNVKQMRQWQKLYQASGAKIPDTWPGKIKPDGHTISVSDVWWVAHHLGMLETVVPATIQELSPGLCTLSTGAIIECDCIIACVGFERNTTVCEALTDKTSISHANYLAPNLIYLADAEIDDGAFNYFFGSSVIEYAKFYSEVFAFAVCHPGLCDEELWGAHVKQSPLHDRKWTQYIGAARTLIKEHADIRAIANNQVDSRMVHFWGSYPPADWVAMNKVEWSELHHRLAGREVSESEQLPYFFDAAPAWCGSDPRLARE